MNDTALKALLFAQPLAVCMTLFWSRLYEYIQRKSQSPATGLLRSRLYAWVWSLQLLLILDLTTIIILDTIQLAEARLSNGASEILQTHLASRTALFLYFAAGLLPDVDEPFNPGLAHAHSWIVASVIQLVLLVPRKRLLHLYDHSYTIATLVCEALFVALVVFNITIVSSIHYRQCSEDDLQYSQIISAEVRPSYGAIQTGTAFSGPQKCGDAQSTGWFDYFIGFRALFPYFWPSTSKQQQATTIFCLFLLVAQRVINILVPYQLERLVAALGYGQMPYWDLALYCVYRGLQGQQGVIGSFRAILWIPISQSLFRRLTYAAYEHVMILSLDFHLSKKIGEVMSALSKGGALNTFLDGFAFQLFPMIFDIGVAAVYLFVRFNVFYSIITVGVLWSYIFATIYMAKWRGRQRRVMTTKDREMEAAKTDTIMAYEMVHYNDALPLELSRFAGFMQSFQRAEFSVLLSLNALNALQNSLFILGVVLVAVLSAYQISIGEESVASFVAIVTYFAQLQAPLAFFGSFYNQVQNNMVDAERMLDLFNKVPDIQNLPNAKSLTDTLGVLEFKDVHFAYDHKRPIVKGISLTVSPGTTTALVGESGSGKSTCLKLMFRFYDVQKGSIEVDGHDIRDLTLESLRKHIGVVPQETILFNDTLMYNLKYANPNASEEQVHQACQAASIHNRILTFPDGYDTVVGERGLKLSGGEKQRIAIARTILKDPAFVFLDEATSSLDSETEQLIQDALRIATYGRTTISIAHRLSTITHADQILVMHEGEILERGTHRSLLAQNGKYTAMWKKQTQEEDGAKHMEGNVS